MRRFRLSAKIPGRIAQVAACLVVKSGVMAEPASTYFVIESDGSRFERPAGVDLLRQWIVEGRLNANTLLEIALTGARVSAGEVGGLFRGNFFKAFRDQGVYGPTDFDALRIAAAGALLRLDTVIEDTTTGERMLASDLPDLFSDTFYVIEEAGTRFPFPAGLDQLRMWAEAGRINGESILENVLTGVRCKGEELDGLFSGPLFYFYVKDQKMGPTDLGIVSRALDNSVISLDTEVEHASTKRRTSVGEVLGIGTTNVDRPVASKEREPSERRRSLIVTLTEEDKKVLLLHDDDWISLRPCHLQLGQRTRMEVPDWSMHTGPLVPAFRQEFIFQCLARKFHGCISWSHLQSDPAGPENTGHQVLMLFYHCKGLDRYWPMAVVGMATGQIWVDMSYSYYAGMRHLSKNRFLRSVTAANFKTVTHAQKELIARLVTSAVQNRPEYARYFQPHSQSETSAVAASFEEWDGLL